MLFGDCAPPTHRKNDYHYLVPCITTTSYRLPAASYEPATNKQDSKPVDHWNNQVWELTFADPLKILGPQRHPGSMNVEKENSNTANVQYKNVLFYKGEFLDYNGNLSDGGGSYSTETAGDKSLHFWSVATGDGKVYIGIIDYPREGGGILEVGLEADYPSFAAFQDRMRVATSHCDDTGLVTRYVNTKGGVITYDHGKATVDGAPFALKDYPTIARLR